MTSHDPLAVIEALGIPTTSPVAAIRFLNGNGVRIDSHEMIIEEMTGVKIDYNDSRLSRYTFLYMVQNLLKSGVPENLPSLVTTSTIQADEFISKNKWAFVTTDNVGTDGKPKRKYGGTKEKAKRLWLDNQDKEYTRKQWIELLIKEVGLTKAGASTYHYNMRKNIW